MTAPSSFRANRAIGAMFFSLFGGAWLALGAVRALGLRWGWVALIACASFGLFFAAVAQFRKHRSALAAEADTPSKRRADRVFTLVNAGQWVLIFLVGTVLNNTGHGAWFFAAAIIIIGAHFLPLARVFAYPPHYVTGGAMMLWGAGYPFLTRAGALNPVGCAGAGLLLWASALYALRATPPVEQAAGSPCP